MRTIVFEVFVNVWLDGGTWLLESGEFFGGRGNIVSTAFACSRVAEFDLSLLMDIEEGENITHQKMTEHTRTPRNIT